MDLHAREEKQTRNLLRRYPTRRPSRRSVLTVPISRLTVTLPGTNLDPNLDQRGIVIPLLRMGGPLPHESCLRTTFPISSDGLTGSRCYTSGMYPC
jgi:hypothetical protein